MFALNIMLNDQSAKTSHIYIHTYPEIKRKRSHIKNQRLINKSALCWTHHPADKAAYDFCCQVSWFYSSSISINILRSDLLIIVGTDKGHLNYAHSLQNRTLCRLKRIGTAHFDHWIKLKQREPLCGATTYSYIALQGRKKSVSENRRYGNRNKMKRKATF